ncbi:DUF1579 family protein [Dyadobacter aurulentus]|uniref:DUF1579 family protein n=1 Tax=Dyadobacter sp. UC 10 TaxID=2605428 RepID=UPI0011F26A90|nr:DUF1579 family protein [Dyadobacter sp. UC 10]KAA0993024.1 DUF1579 domain-containing protein [Dyadobacter sp. UC 10]
MNDTRKPELVLLDRIVGDWHTSGTLNTGNGSLNIKGTDSYQWLPGGHFLMHTVDVMMGGDRKQSIEIIGFDILSGTYPMHFYDDQGESGVMHGSFIGDEWNIISPELRFKGHFSNNYNKLSGVWEHCTDNNWQHLMDIQLLRATL